MFFGPFYSSKIKEGSKRFAGERFLFNLVGASTSIFAFTLFIFYADCKITVVGGTFIFRALSFSNLLLSSSGFCSAAKAFPPLATTVNISTPYLSFKSLIFTCCNSLSTSCCIVFFSFFYFLSHHKIDLVFVLFSQSHKVDINF